MKITSIPLFTATLLAVSTLGAAASVPRAASVAMPQTVTVPSLKGVRDIGRAAGVRVDISVALPYRHGAELHALLSAQRDAASPLYRRYLSREQFRNYFSPDPNAYTRSVLALRRAGFEVEPFANRTLVHAVADARVAESYFKTTIDRVLEASGRLAYANVRPATIPGELGASTVVGLNSLVIVRAAASERRQPAGLRALAVSPLFGPDGGFGPVAVAKAEDYPVEHGYMGTGSNVADIFDGAVTDSDVATFLHTFGITRTGPRTTTIRVDGGCGSACFDSFSTTLDAEWTLAMAPGASLFTYQVPALTNGSIADAFNRIASDDAVNVVNVSFGACEVNFADALLAIEPLIAQGASEGIAYESVAFGGAQLCGIPQLALPMAPADLDTVTAVGGSNTVTESNGKQDFETGYAGSNGGVSLLIPLPVWQAKTPGVMKTGRNVPDLVLPAEVDGTGPSIYFGGKWVGGSPFINNAPFAGYLATVQQMYGLNTPLFNVAPYLYATLDKYGYRSKSAAYFTDITLGCNGAVGNKPVCAKHGYDLTTGIGSIAGGYSLAKSFALGPIQPANR